MNNIIIHRHEEKEEKKNVIFVKKFNKHNLIHTVQIKKEKLQLNVTKNPTQDDNFFGM